MSIEFTEAAAKLVDAHDQFSSDAIKPVQHADLRGPALCEALAALASEFGVTLQQPLQIDSRGEFSIVAMPADGKSPDHGAGHFGEGFAILLNGYAPRIGTSPGATLLPESGWCRMSHFNVEKMILHRLASLSTSPDGESMDAPTKPKKMRP